MNIVNAIARVRFGTAKPQRIRLHKGGKIVVELLCMEAGQKLSIKSGEWAYYVVIGRAELTADQQTHELPTAQLATVEPGQAHVLANPGEGRLVILAAGHPA